MTKTRESSTTNAIIRDQNNNVRNIQRNCVFFVGLVWKSVAPIFYRFDHAPIIPTPTSLHNWISQNAAHVSGAPITTQRFHAFWNGTEVIRGEWTPGG